MMYAPKGLQPTIIDREEIRREQRERMAKVLGKTVDELTPEELEEANAIPALDDPCDAFRD